MQKTVRALAAMAVLALLPVTFGTPSAVAAGETLTPSSTSFGYNAGPYTNVNVSGLVGAACDVPSGCDIHEFSVNVPPGYYAGLRAQGKVGIVQIAASWADNDNDFDLALKDDAGNPIATSGFGNSDFERINYTELPSGQYSIEMAIFRTLNASFHMDVRLIETTPTPTAVAPGDGGLSFSNSTPVALERSSGEPNMEIAPDGAVFVDIPLGAGTNSILYKSTDNSDTFKPLAPLHLNNNPLPTNAAGGGDSGAAIDPQGRICFSELNTLLSLAVGCSSDGGKTFPLSDSSIADPDTPLVDRQWQVATPQKEQYISAQFGILTAGTSQPGIRLWKEVAGSDKFLQVQEIDAGVAMKTYNMAVDMTDTDANGGTVVQAYLRPNEGADKPTNPHQLMVWQTNDGGTTATKHVVANLPTSPGNNFASVDVDRSGNVYVAWSEQGTWDILYSVAKKGDLDHWSAPVRVNAEPLARTAIQPTIKVGDRGRVFIGFYAAPQYGNPDSLPAGEWNAFMSVSTDGACQLDATPCAKPVFHQEQITEHVVQHRGICLGGTGCGGDPYYGDRSMLEYLDIAFSPATGQAHVVTTDSSRTNGGTTITMYRQVSGPSAFAAAAPVAGVDRRTTSAEDPGEDAMWPYESPAPSTHTPAADIRKVSVSYPDVKTLRVVMQLSDVSGFQEAITNGVGDTLVVATRFSTDLDVLWVGMRVPKNGSPTFAAGHLTGGLLVDTYAPDSAIDVTGAIDTDARTITMDVPLDSLKTTLQQPDTAQGAAPQVPAVAPAGRTLYGVTGFSYVTTERTEDTTAKHWLDVAPAFTTGAVVPPRVPDEPTRPGGGTGGTGGNGTGGGGDDEIATTGAPGWAGLVALGIAAVAVVGFRVRRRTG
jgi:hypothetical protein